ncbi:MAG: PAS domain-containing protein [Victivallales bacterium]|nr:PAS domain-containing protein [Victivallales bacterium]
MEFYYKKFRELRKSRGISSQELCRMLDISRTTLWKWENNKVTPSPDFIRLISKKLNINVSEVSSLLSEPKQALIDYSDSAETCNLLLDIDMFSVKNKKLNKALAEIASLQTDLDQASLILNAIFRGIGLIFYIKDTNLKYVAANKMFLNNLSLHSSYKVIGKTDYDFFPQNEAKENIELDKEVLYKGKSYCSEGFIYGTRKKKWGIIEKHPIPDQNGKLIGLICTLKDVTEQRRAEAENVELQREKDILYSAVNSIEKVIVLLYNIDINRKVKYRFVSRNLQKILGYNTENFIKNCYPLISIIHPDQKQLIDNHFRKKDSGFFKYIFDIRKEDGSYIKMEGRGEKRKNPDGTFTVLGILTKLD